MLLISNYYVIIFVGDFMEYQEIERSIIKKFRKKLWCRFARGVDEYNLVQDGDKIAVCISGGKDSFILAKLFQELKRHGRINFELEFIVMNPGYNKENIEKFRIIKYSSNNI